MPSSTLQQFVAILETREAWWLEDLPAEFTLDGFMALDAAGHVEACRHDLPPGHKCQQWFSPARLGLDDGQWATLLKVGWPHKVQVRLSGLARAQIALDKFREPGEPGATAGAARKAKNFRGRPADTDLKQDERWHAAWGSGVHRTYAECAAALDTTPLQFKRALDRVRKRQEKS